MRKRLSHQAWFISAIIAAILFTGAVASNLIANYLQTSLEPYRRWVWVSFGITLLVAIGAAVKEVRERHHSIDDGARSINIARGDGSLLIDGEANANKIVSGNDNLLGESVRIGRDYFGRVDIQITDPDYFAERVTRDEQPFDREVYRGAEWGDLAVEAIKDFLELDRVKLQQDYQSRLNPKQQLEQFCIVRQGAKPTIAANLCFGESPNKAVVGCQTRCSYWKDESRNGFYESRDFDGNLVSQMNGAISFVKRNLRLGRNIGDEGRFEEYDVPMQAVAEAIANALVHREYRNRNDFVRIDLFDNKIEIISPGSLPTEVPLELLGVEQCTYPRNPLIARIFYLYGYVEQAGTGISRMTKAMAAKGLPAPEFKIGGTDTFKVILRRPLLAPMNLSPAGRHQVPPPSGDFVGREQEIETLINALRYGNRTSISAINGMGGIGKTELALLVAQRLAGDYPDAQFFINLQGTDPNPRSPQEVMSTCIRAFLGPEARLPEELDQLSQLYRSELSGKRVLLLLDNAADSAQVRPLLPPTGSALLVTSRQVITLPGMTALLLDALADDEARELLLEIAPRAAPAAEQICQLCGYLPLAIRAAGSLLAITLDLDPLDYVARLKDERNRLERLGTEGVEIDVAASFNLSYAQLTLEGARVFRMLSIFPGTFDADAVEVVCDDAGHVCLSELVRRSLVLYDDNTKRYRLHDLARLFADAKLNSEERLAGQKRHATHYLDVLLACEDLYQEGGAALVSGLALFDLEWGNIQAGHTWVAAQDVEVDDEVARLGMDYPDMGAYILNLRQHSRQRIRWLEIALAAAKRLKDRAVEGSALGNLGLAYAALGETQRAIEFYEQSRTIARALDNRIAEGAAQGNLGAAYANLGETQRAIQFYEQALLIDRKLGDLRGQGNVLNNLGVVYAALGETQRAIEFYEQALLIHREIGDRRGEGADLGSLGSAYYHLGETERAIEFYEQYLNIAREIGDRRSEGNGLFDMSRALDRLSKRAQAIEHAEQSLKIYEQIEDPRAAKVRAKLAVWREETISN